MKYGYARVSPGGKSDSVDAQTRQPTKAGCRKVFRDVHVSGAKNDRAQLRRLLDQLAPGDVLMVTRLDRLARSTRDQSRWLSRRLGVLRPYIERFDNQWMMQHPATGVTWDALEVATSLTGHPGTKHSLRQVFPKLRQILGRLDTLDPNEEIPADRGESAQDEWTSAGRAVALLGIGSRLGKRTICQRAYAGLIRACAKRFIRNGQKMGRPFKLTDHQKHEARKRREQGETLADIGRSYNVSPATISRLAYLRTGANSSP
jgi:DNA invertase Pin-like site-specific DNA recombinase